MFWNLDLCIPVSCHPVIFEVIASILSSLRLSCGSMENEIVKTSLLMEASHHPPKYKHLISLKAVWVSMVIRPEAISMCVPDFSQHGNATGGRIFFPGDFVT